MAKYLSQIACLLGVALFVGAGVVSETEGVSMQLASEPPAAERSIEVSPESADRGLNWTPDAMVARKSDTSGLAQRHEDRASCRSVRHERCDE